jgi:hypothetical protein
VFVERRRCAATQVERRKEGRTHRDRETNTTELIDFVLDGLGFALVSLWLVYVVGQT